MAAVALGMASAPLSVSAANTTNTTMNTTSIFDLDRRVVVTNQAMGARCAVAADFDGDGRQDLVSASSNDNAVSWFRNEGPSADGRGVSFSIKQQITWSSLGSRIVTVADIDGDGNVDVIGASYYDSSLRWFENDGTGQFTPHVISTAVNEGQGVAVADLDNDGDPDTATASSGDNTIAVFKNLDKGVFCEIKEVVDDNAVGARTVIASDLNGDGWIDLASASRVRFMLSYLNITSLLENVLSTHWYPLKNQTELRMTIPLPGIQTTALVISPRKSLFQLEMSLWVHIL